MNLRLTLIAHAATKATRASAFPADEALEPIGRSAAEAFVGRLGRVDAAWTSPALRAVETASSMGLAASAEPALSEIDFADWAGRSLSEVAEADPSGLAHWTEDFDASPHGGEPISALVSRVGSWLQTLETRSGRFVAVTHASVIRAATIIALDANPRSFWRIDVAPLCFSRFQRRGGAWTVSFLNSPTPGKA